MTFANEYLQLMKMMTSRFYAYIENEVENKRNHSRNEVEIPQIVNLHTLQCVCIVVHLLVACCNLKQVKT